MISPLAYRALINKEIEKFLAESMWPRNSDPMVWWENHVGEYPYLKTSVLKYLSAPPSSVASERLFSAAGRVYTENRNRLLPANAERLIRIMRNNALVLGKKPVNPFVEEEFDP